MESTPENEKLEMAFRRDDEVIRQAIEGRSSGHKSSILHSERSTGLLLDLVRLMWVKMCIASIRKTIVFPRSLAVPLAYLVG